MSEEEEEEVSHAIARARRGDLEAFAVLFERFAPMVHGILLTRGVSRDDTQDLVQDVFEIAMSKLAGLRDNAAMGPWLATIARNRATDTRRASSRRGRALPIGDGEGEHDVPDEKSPTPSARIDAERVLAMILDLPQAYRETLVLRLVEGMSGPEIAKQVGMTADSVRVNLHRGMTMLRERLKDHAKPDTKPDAKKDDKE